MHVLRNAARSIQILLAVALLAAAPPLVPAASAAADDVASDIVLVLDLSGSILDDEPTRTAFAEALEGIALRVEEVSDTLVAGDATVSIVQFATQAADLPDCTELGLRENPGAVTSLAECLRRVATTYRSGVQAAVIDAIGDDTNYVAAMEQAAVHLPEDSDRPGIIFFTDGRHEADGVPVSEVVPARDRLFAERTPFALLPVGMGLDAADRATLEEGLVNLRITREFERCEGGLLDWPQVVFESAEAAGQAVALALQDVSCTFTVEATPTPVPTPTAAPLAAVRSIRLEPADASVVVSWVPPIDAEATPVDGYRVRCRPQDGGDDDWIESSDVGATETSATVEGLTNGVDHVCEVAAVRGDAEPAWTSSGTTAAPFGRPPAPLKPSAEAGDGGVRLGVELPAEAPMTGVTYECSADGGATWAVSGEAGGSRTSLDVSGLENGREYVCRIAAVNASGASDASPVSDVFRPCSGFVGCNPWVLPVLGVLLALVAGALLLLLWRWYSGRRVYVTAQVDYLPIVSLGRGPRVGLSLIKRGPYRRLANVVADEGAQADVRIRYAGGENFVIHAGKSRTKAKFGREVQITDGDGQPHTVIVRAFDEPPLGTREG